MDDRLILWLFGLVPSERNFEAAGKSVHLHIISKSRLFDLFPHTSELEKNGIFESKNTL